MYGELWEGEFNTLFVEYGIYGFVHIEMYTPVVAGIHPHAHSDIYTTISQFLDMGHSEVFETRVCQIDEEAHPEQQVHINIYIKRRENDGSNL